MKIMHIINDKHLEKLYLFFGVSRSLFLHSRVCVVSRICVGFLRQVQTKGVLALSRIMLYRPFPFQKPQFSECKRNANS